MQYVHDKTNAAGVRIGHFPVDREEIECVVAEQTGARKAVIQALIDGLIDGRSLASRALIEISYQEYFIVSRVAVYRQSDY